MAENPVTQEEQEEEEKKSSFQDIVKKKIRSWTDDNARRYNVEVFYDE